jgi:salicylate hydroxylase
MADARFRIAIVGGGFAGATLASALVQIPHVGIEVYESTPQFSERGAALVLTSTAQKALQRTIPLATEVLRKAGAVPMNSTRLAIVSRRMIDHAICRLSS